MTESGQTSPKGNWIARLWRFFWRPSPSIALGVLMVAGFVLGILFWGGFHTAIDMSNTEEFCIGCHEMQDNPYEEMQDTIHFVNRTGIRAVCADCHVPKDWVHKIPVKIAASTELYAHLIGKLDTPEKYEEERLQMAVSVWGSMKNSDSRECRNCHRRVWMDMSEQFGSARRAHQLAIDDQLTCIDCHQGIAHKLPEGFEEPSNDQLEADADEWLAKMRELAESRE